MQNRQQIREQFGILEEQLEELGALACGRDGVSTVSSDLLLQDALESVRELSRLVHDQQLLKSVPADDFLMRICGLLAQDARTQGVDIAISRFGEGRISMEMAELVLGAVVSGYRASLRSLKATPRLARLKSHLFATGSVYLEVKATSGEIQFRLIDDGRGIGESEASDRSFQKLREHIARCGGWLSRKSFGTGGGMIEFKVPLAHNRADALVLRQGGFELLVPVVCVAETSRGGKGPPEGVSVYRLHESDGLAEGGEGCPELVRVGVADLHFWIGCDAVSGPVKARRAPAESFVEEGCWLKSLGVFQEGGVSRALPLLDGPALVRFRKAFGGEV